MEKKSTWEAIHSLAFVYANETYLFFLPEAIASEIQKMMKRTIRFPKESFVCCKLARRLICYIRYMIFARVS